MIRRVLETDLPHSLALGVLGLNGVTALIGLRLIRCASTEAARRAVSSGACCN